MSYTINPNAKNKWARNADNTMDLSLETDASSVYLDNGRTLEQELGEGSMISNVTTVDSAMSKVVDGTLDGAYESCVFKGKSLVNLMTSCKDETLIEYCNPPANSNVANVSMIKPNTVYTIIYSAKYREEGDTGHLIVRTQQDGGDINVSSGFTFGTTYKRFAYKFTTPSTIDYFVLRSNGHYFHVKEIMLLEGDYTNIDIPYFEGICDVKMPILRNVGKNLFDKTKITKNCEFYNDKIVETKGCFVSDYIPVRPNTDYKLIKTIRIHIFDENKNLIKYPKPTDGIFTTPTNASFIRINGQLTELDIWQVEEGSTTTSYEPYKTNILRTSEEIVLREVNGVCDTYNPLTGEYVRRIGEIVLDGSEDWIIHNNNHSNRIVFKTSSKLSGYNTTTSIADKIRTSKITTGISNLFGYSFLRIGEDTAAPTAGVFLHLEGELISISNVAKLIEWLQANPITVQYELKTPITTTVESLTTPFAYQNGHVILESGYEGQSLLPTLEYSTVVNKTGQIESVAKTIQRQEKQLTMLEQMLIQNIINLDYNNTLLTLKNEMEEML